MRYGLVICSFSLFSTTILAGGWPQKKGHAYFKLYEWFVIADRHYTDTGHRDPNTTHALFNTTFYGEYGLTDRVTAIVSAPLFSRAYFNNTRSATTGELLIPGEEINAIGDVDVAFRVGLLQGNGPAVSATLTFGLPLGVESGGPTGILQTGDGEFNQMLQVDAGLGFQIGSLPAYANVYTGFNNRTRGYSDEWRFGAEMGVRLFDRKLWIIARLYGVQSVHNGDPDAFTNVTSIFANNSEHLTFAPELSWNIGDNWGVTAGYATAFSGRIIFAAPAYSFGVFRTLGDN